MTAGAIWKSPCLDSALAERRYNAGKIDI